MEITPAQAVDYLAEIENIIRDHNKKQSFTQGFGTPAERVRAICREYEDKAVRALSDVKQVRDDMLTFFRALALVLNMTGNAGTHAEKAARLRGAIELLESAIEKLRTQNFEDLFSVYRWPDLFRSDWPTRRLMEKIYDLEARNKELEERLKLPLTQPADPTGDAPVF